MELLLQEQGQTIDEEEDAEEQVEDDELVMQEAPAAKEDEYEHYRHDAVDEIPHHKGADHDDDCERVHDLKRELRAGGARSRWFDRLSADGGTCRTQV